jgi:hypothetical protein
MKSVLSILSFLLGAGMSLWLALVPIYFIAPVSHTFVRVLVWLTVALYLGAIVDSCLR